MQAEDPDEDGQDEDGGEPTQQLGPQGESTLR
jgi:hypothetical protein